MVTNCQKGILVILLIFFSTRGLSQKINIDSIFSEVNKTYRTDSDKAIYLLDSIKSFVTNQGSKAQKLNYHLNYYKVIYYAKGEKKKALDHLHNALLHAEGNKEKAMVYNKLGQYHHRSSSMLDSSMHYLIKSIETTKKNADTYRLTHYYLDLGDLYMTLGDLPKAAEFTAKSLEIARAGGKRMDYGYSLYNAIKVYEQLKDTNTLRLLQQEYELFNAGKTAQSAAAHQTTTFIANGSEKKKFLETSIQAHDKKQNLTMLRTNRLLLADQLSDEKNYDQAIKVLEEGLDDLGDSLLLFRQNYYSKLKNLCVKKGDFTSALKYADSLRSVELAMFDEKRMSTIRELEAKYNKLEQDNRIFLLQQERSISNRNMYLALLGVGLISSLAFGIYLLYRQKSKNNDLLKFKNEQITSMLHEKDLLLREIHHRVKNNLQVVSSLLNLQSNYITDDIALEAINEGKNRVLSMALIHQNLYTDEHLTAIETKGYFDDLLDQVFESYNIDEDRILLEKDIDSFLIDVDTMIPLGLITNELISNALKHAFKGRNHGKIFFSAKNMQHEIMLRLKDNGIGVEPSLFSSSPSFGNKMIQTFVQKLKASFQVANENGTEITLTIPKSYKQVQRA